LCIIVIEGGKLQDEKQDQIQDFSIKLLEKLRKHQVKRGDEFTGKLCGILHSDHEIINDLPSFLQTCRGTWNMVKQESQAGKYILKACFWTWCNSWRQNMQMTDILAEHEIDPETFVLDGWTLKEILYSDGTNGEQE